MMSGAPSRSAVSAEWVHSILQDELGYTTPHPHQVVGVQTLLQGRDLVATIRTGSGKSTFIHGTLVGASLQAKSAREQYQRPGPTTGILILPTKTLADDQVRDQQCAPPERTTHLSLGPGRLIP